MTFKQSAHPLLLIPGSIEVADNVLEANGSPSMSHTHQPFIGIFQSALQNLRKLFKSTDHKAQAFVISGSGTLGWDIVASNLIKPKEDALVLSTGFFSDRFADALTTYGVNTDVIRADLGDYVSYEEIEKALGRKKYKIITITHVDTSTAVLSNVEEISKIVKKVSPETLIVVDGVCSVAVEDIEFDKWGIDYVLTASQKAIGVPPGLSISFISGRALDVALNRDVDTTYFASLKRWDIIMKAYESGKGAYFATPSVQLINALKVSLENILCKPLDERFKLHIENSDWFKGELEKLGLKLVSKKHAGCHALTAAYFPEGVTGANLFPLTSKRNVVFAGGVHKDIATKYFRVGHMGVSVVDRDDTKVALEAIKESLLELSVKS
ncbi:alanine--glyoxylate transaminase [Saccharomycopsis crataegensis]|uniref:alanine--glyoxylate transaminase n=1 Tax=Saccharomycopsis crataegensis TaxID=43959 RepID=A0AAV5QRW4_9ASCO|nr:alanine--glyoxylate transaminase [Saccharomycopsis crataegensis]